MAKDRSLVRASDIGQWAYCRRAWWLARVKHAPHHRPATLLAGQRIHNAHGRGLAMAQRLALLGRVLILLAVFVVIVLLAALALFPQLAPYG